MKSTTHLLTNDGKRIAKRLVNHWKHKFEVQETEQDFKILMPTATITLAPETEQ
ncbi:DUF2218 domain-containing protein, partial [Acinetobacter baumannii]|nr:DUF2218 domain-containing protein [Acinetobacter baumannii]